MSMSSVRSSTITTTGSSTDERTPWIATNNTTTGTTTTIPIQQILPQIDDSDDEILSHWFFELANAPVVTWAIPSATTTVCGETDHTAAAATTIHSPATTTLVTTNTSSSSSSSPETTSKTLSSSSSSSSCALSTRVLTIPQYPNTACHNHTGGIVWETSLLLSLYLYHTRKEWISTIIANKNNNNNISSLVSAAAAVVPPVTFNDTSQTTCTTIVEVGAGCGLLGMSLGTWISSHLPPMTIKSSSSSSSSSNRWRSSNPQIIITETPTVVEQQLRANWKINQSLFTCPVYVTPLDWTEWERYLPTNIQHTVSNNPNSVMTTTCGSSATTQKVLSVLSPCTSTPFLLSRGCADMILGTDVIFSPALVQPLLETLQALLRTNSSNTTTSQNQHYYSVGTTNSSSGNTQDTSRHGKKQHKSEKHSGWLNSSSQETYWVPTIWLCVQIRCAVSHEQFMDGAQKIFHVERISDDRLRSIPECRWGPTVGCNLYRLTRR